MKESQNPKRGIHRREPGVWKKARDAGIDGMLTDYPLECRVLWRMERR